jgi:flagellar motor protein MotB
MKGFIMGSLALGRRGVRMGIGKALLAAAGLPVVLLAGTGCQNKLQQERDALVQQNRELQGQLNERNSMRSQEAPLTPPDPIKPAEPMAVRPLPPAPAAPPPVVAIPPAPAPQPPADLGGDVTVDPVAGTTTVNFLGDALFDSGRATLKDSAKANLNKMVAGLKGQYAGKPVKVQGHSDSDPIKVSKWKSNQELSEARAKAVREYLVSKGVPADQVSAEGFGDAKPKSRPTRRRTAGSRSSWRLGNGGAAHARPFPKPVLKRKT